MGGDVRDALGGGGGGGNHTGAGGGGGGGDVSKAVAPPIRSRRRCLVDRGARAPRPARAARGAASRVTRFRGAAGAPSTLGPGTADVHTGADSGHGEKRKDRDRDDERREKRHKKHHAHKDETPEEREARVDFSTQQGTRPPAAAAAMGGADGAIGTPHATPRPASNVASPSGVMMTPAKPPGSTPPSEAPWRGARTSSLRARQRVRRRELGPAADAIAAAGMGARVSSSCKDRFRGSSRDTAPRWARRLARGGQLRATPELTRRCFASSRETPSPAEGCRQGCRPPASRAPRRRFRPRWRRRAPPRRAFARGLGDPSSDPRVARPSRRRRETSPPRTRDARRETRVWGHGEERRGVVIGVCVMRVTRARGATARDARGSGGGGVKDGTSGV